MWGYTHVRLNMILLVVKKKKKKKQIRATMATNVKLADYLNLVARADNSPSLSRPRAEEA